MSRMLEKIAKVLAKAGGMHPDAVSNDEDELPIWTTYLDVADAVLEVMMEPSDEMLWALSHYGMLDGDPLMAWQETIKAARNGK